MDKKKIAATTLMAVLPLLIILGNFHLLAFSESFYREKMTDNFVYKDIEYKTANNLTASIISYMDSGKELDSTVFIEREIEHMRDVRQLMQAEKILLSITMILAAVAIAYLLAKDKNTLLMAVYKGSIATLLITLITLIIVLFAFGPAFTLFHKILFRNDLWLLPADSMLIKLLPQQFFIDFAKRLGLNTIITASILMFIGSFKR